MAKTADYVVRELADSELREATAVFRHALHYPPPSDEEWERTADSFARGRYLGAVADGAVIGTTYTYASSMSVPGGRVLPLGATARGSVRADFTRRGVLTDLMRAQATDSKEHGEVLTTGQFSEAPIFGRFGYGIGAYARTVRIRGAQVWPAAPRAGRVRLIDLDEARKVLPGLYERIGLHRPGMMSRGPDLWAMIWRSVWTGHTIAVHSGPDGDDGFLMYRTEWMHNAENRDHATRLTVSDLHAESAGALHDLWQFLFGIDLVGEVVLQQRPTDEQVELLLTDPRRCRTDDLTDHLWVRLVDVPVALAARSYGDAEPVVLGINDRFLPENSGTYEISPAGASRVSSAAALELDSDVLAMMYMGSARPSGLAAAGRIKVLDADAVARADRLFASDQVAWCGTEF